jgi:predicted Zn-dependent protease
VVAYGPNGAGITFDSGPKNYGGSMYDYLRQTWGRKAKLAGLKAIKINGLDAATATTRGNSNGKVVDVRLVAIQGREGHTFRLTYLSPTNQTRQLAAPYQTSMNSFGHMSRRELARLGPYRIRLYRARQGDTVERIVRNQMAVKRFALDHFKLLNGMSDETGIAPGRIVKVISDR